MNKRVAYGVYATLICIALSACAIVEAGPGAFQSMFGGPVLCANATTGQVPTRQADGSWQPGTPSGGASGGGWTRTGTTIAPTNAGDVVHGNAGQEFYIKAVGAQYLHLGTTGADGQAGVVLEATGNSNEYVELDSLGAGTGSFYPGGTVDLGTTGSPWHRVKAQSGTGALPSYSFSSDTGAGMSLGDGFLQFSLTGSIMGQFDQGSYFYPGSQTDVGIASISTHVITFSSGAGDHAGVGVVGGVSLNVVTSTSGPVALPLSSAHNNAGAVGSVTFNLPLTPSVASGTQAFRVVAAQNLVIRAPNGVTVYMGAMAAPVGGTWTSSTPGSTVTLEYQGSSIWVATADTGIWVPS